MKLLVLSVGRPRASWAAAGVEAYRKRLSKSFPAGWEVVPEERGASPDSCLAAEGTRMLKLISSRDRVALLDERGISRTSRDFAVWLFETLDRTAGRLVLAVGGAWGVGEAVRSRADETLSLSLMTLPHELCLVVLFEQLYRATTIRFGMPYHH